MTCATYLARRGPAIMFSVLLAACSAGGDSGSNSPEADSAMTSTSSAQPPAIDTTGAPILLETLGPDDHEIVQLSGELGCAFYASRGDEPLFIGLGFVSDEESAEGLVKIDGSPVKLAMEGAGGYDRMAAGARFTGTDLAVEVNVTGAEPLPEDPPIAGESPMHHARMSVARAGRELQIDGYYECGP